MPGSVPRRGEIWTRPLTFVAVSAVALFATDRFADSTDRLVSVPGAWALRRGDSHLPSPAGRWFRRPRARIGHAAGESS